MNKDIFKKKLHEIEIDALLVLIQEEIQLSNTTNTAIEARFQLADLYIKKSEYPKAVNVYIEILEIEPSNENALYKKENTMAIVAQSQLDIYACTNTHLDPWN